MFTKLWNFLDHAFFDFRRGGSLRGIRNSALIGCMSHNAVEESSLSYLETVLQPMCGNESYMHNTDVCNTYEVEFQPSLLL